MRTIAAGLLAIALLALFNRWAGPAYCLGLLYLLPIAAAAWWAGPAHGMLLALAGACAWQFVDSATENMHPLAVGLCNGVLRFGTFALTASLLHRLRLGILREQTFAQTDALTGVLNVRALHERLLLEVERACRDQLPLSLAYIDLDHFKTLNDERGHRAGDEALVQFARLIQANIRRVDALGRVGGDEFCLLLPGTDTAGTLLLLTRLQALVEGAMSARGWPITTSIGAVTFRQPPLDPDAMLQLADALMYGAKRGGKNRIHHEEVKSGPPLAMPDRIERRTAARLASGLTARVRVVAGVDLGLAVVRNVSRTGLNLSLAQPVPLHACLLVERLGAGGPPAARATVVRADDYAGAWDYGCELAEPLSELDLQGWLGQDTSGTPALANQAGREREGR